ncbi:hypothetical protein BDZ45DRAFT_730208 [Acephala macrosclerotiorum]|nr:hypothetical protein BDZ45DRAFT_730208 [Acephala macrosclerotiorum]
MLRCPPTTIVLGRSDILEYEKRQQRRKELKTDKVNQEFARLAVGETDVPRFSQAFTLTDDETQPRSHTVEERFPDFLLHDTVLDSIELEHSDENPTRKSEARSSSLIKHGFDYGGFVESPLPQGEDNTSHRSSPFIPDGFSTPQNGQYPDARRLRRAPLPRSPLFLSQNATTSPDDRPTTRLTPRVTSRVATHNTPGIIFARPPRRPPRSSPRTLRHQTNSFSFDSSERASAAYEQERVISNSTDDSIPHPSEDVSLHDELRGSSLQSSRISSGVPAFYGIQSGNAMDIENETHGTNRDFMPSSPAFPLPPPFSSVSRRASNADSLPPATSDYQLREYQPQNPATSPVKGPASTQKRGRGEVVREGPKTSPVIPAIETNESPPSGGRITSFLNRIASYRVRSPLHRGAPSGSSSPALTSMQTPDWQTSANLNPQTPSQSYRVYNDALPPDTQPQTPANLPEARHQSRYHASYTAPVTRNVAQRGASSINTTNRAGTRSSVRRQAPFYTPVRASRVNRRTDSPTGMRDEGFEGLYGGRENGDEEQNWVEGVRFNNAEARLWGARDAGNDAEALRETPEPEDWRVGRRN